VCCTNQKKKTNNNEIVNINESLLDSINFEENGEKYRVLITLLTEGSPYNSNWKSIISCNVFNSDKYQSLSFKDSATNQYTFMQYIEKSLKIIDINSDGQKELMFSYKHHLDGLDPDVLYYFLVYHHKQYFIKAILPKHKDDLSKYNISYTNFINNCPSKIKNFCSKEVTKINNIL
jgi:hypothetical protein